MVRRREYLFLGLSLSPILSGCLDTSEDPSIGFRIENESNRRHTFGVTIRQRDSVMLDETFQLDGRTGYATRENVVSGGTCRVEVVVEDGPEKTSDLQLSKCDGQEVLVRYESPTELDIGGQEC